jgi:hypothetical protein
MLFKYNKLQKRVVNSACPEGIPIQLNFLILLSIVQLNEGLL